MITSATPHRVSVRLSTRNPQGALPTTTRGLVGGATSFDLYLALSKSRANLGMARHQLRMIESSIEI